MHGAGIYPPRIGRMLGQPVEKRIVTGAQEPAPVENITVQLGAGVLPGAGESPKAWLLSPDLGINAQWDHTFIRFRVRPGQEGVRFQFAYWNQNETRLLLDSFSLRKLDDATLSRAPLERTSILKGGLAADPIADPTASDVTTIARGWFDGIAGKVRLADIRGESFREVELGVCPAEPAGTMYFSTTPGTTGEKTTVEIERVVFIRE